MSKSLLLLLISILTISPLISCKKLDAKAANINIKDKINMVSAQQRGVYSNKLFIAAHALDRVKIDELLKSGIDINGQTKGSHNAGQTIIMTLLQNVHSQYISKDNNKEAVMMLLFSNAVININIQNDRGNSALFYSLGIDNNSLTKMFLQLGADVNIKNLQGYTPLMSAVKDIKNIELVKLLIDVGADINIIDEYGITALGYSVSTKEEDNNSIEITKLLLDAGAKVNRKNTQATTALMRAVKSGNLNSATLLVDVGANINDKNAGGRTAINFAYKPEITQMLIDRGADHSIIDAILIGDIDSVNDFIKINGIDENDRNLLSIAIQYNRTDIAKLLIEQGLLINLIPLAAKYKNIEIVDLLILKGMNVNEPYQNRSETTTALIEASRVKGNKDIVKTLLYAGADVNAVESYLNKTALTMCIEYGDNDTATLLIKSKSNLNHIDREGNAPIDIATKMGKHYIVDLLIKNGAPDDLTRAIKYGITNKVESLLSASNDFDAIDKNGDTALIIAIKEKNINLVKLIIDKGVNINLISSINNYYYNYSPLMIASQNANKEMVYLLIENGADVNLTNSYSMSALMATIYDQSEVTPEKIEIMKILIAAGADVNLSVIENETALDRVWGDVVASKLLIDNGADVNSIEIGTGGSKLIGAAYQGDDEMVKYLLEHGADYTIKDYEEDKTALMFAKDKGYNRVIKLLMDAGAKE